MRFDLWTKQHGGQGIDRHKMHSFEFGHLRGDYFGLNIVLRSFVMQRWISMKDHTTLCLHAEFVATHAKPPLSRWNKEHDVDFCQPPDISCSHLYRGTFPWTPTTAIYRAYTVTWKIGPRYNGTKLYFTPERSFQHYSYVIMTNECGDDSNHWHLDCLLNCLFRHGSKNVSIWWRHQEDTKFTDDVPIVFDLQCNLEKLDDRLHIINWVSEFNSLSVGHWGAYVIKMTFILPLKYSDKTLAILIMLFCSADSCLRSILPR